ncbi:MAG: helix-turn-helix transcriptional regulator [Gemmatimonadota bacterium]|nr:helix-turn-helix transcriptional regulator [Gemmatimonadota bacterium]
MAEHLDFGRFFGDAAPARAIGRVQLCEAVYRRRDRLPSHAHAAPYLSFVVAGSYVETVGARQLACETHTLRFHPAGEEHADVFGAQGAVCMNVELAGDWDETLAGLALGDEPVITDAALWPALRLRRAGRYRDVASALALEEATLELLEFCSRLARLRRVASESRSLARALECVATHMESGAVAISLGEIAAAAGVHVTHLARLFRQRLHCTVAEHVRSGRLVRAQHQIVERPEWTLSRIAAEQGFADHAHFTRTFVRAFDITPSGFRRAAQEEGTAW